MSPQELLAEIRKLPPEDQHRLIEALTRDAGRESLSSQHTSEDDAERALQAKGIISAPDAAVYADEEEDFEPEEIEGESLSETIIEGRR